MSICGSKNKPRDNKDSGKKKTLANTTEFWKFAEWWEKCFENINLQFLNLLQFFSMQPLKTATFNSLQNEVIDIQLTRSVQQEMDPALRHLNT